MWWIAGLAGLFSVLTRWTSPSSATMVGQRTGPVLIFLVAITIVAGLADEAGLFAVAAREAARWGRGRVWLLWLLLVVLATLSTVVLSLDTTAVLLTPVVLVLARQLAAPPLLFAMTTVWLANTASLLLPVSNLTNLLALHQFTVAGLNVRSLVGLTWAPALVSVVVTAGVLAVMFRRQLRMPYTVPRPPEVTDRALFWLAAGICVALVPAFVSDVQVAWPASLAAALLVAGFLLRRREALRFSLVPWRLVILVLGLFLVVQGLHDHGLAALLAEVAGRGSA